MSIPQHPLITILLIVYLLFILVAGGIITIVLCEGLDKPINKQVFAFGVFLLLLTLYCFYCIPTLIKSLDGGQELALCMSQITTIKNEYSMCDRKVGELNIVVRKLVETCNL